MSKQELLDKFVQLSDIANKKLHEFKEMHGTIEEYKKVYEDYLIASDVADVVWDLYLKAVEEEK